MRPNLLTGSALLAVQAAISGPLLTRNAPSAPAAEQRRGTPPDARGSRFATFSGQSYDATARTVEAVLSVGTRVRRGWFEEELAIAPEAVDLQRAGAGQVRLLDSHNQFEIEAVLGVVDNVRIEGSQLLGRIRFADTDRGRTAEGMVSRGEVTGISIGYLVRTWQLVETSDDDRDVWRAASWELMEVSLVSVPADPNAGVRSAPSIPGETAAAGGLEEDPEMLLRNQPGGGAAPVVAAALAAASTVIEARAEPAAATAPAPTATVNGTRLITLARNAGLDAEAIAALQDTHAATPFTEERLLADIGRRFAERDAPAQTQSRVSVTRDEGDTRRLAMGEAILARMAPSFQAHESAREYRGMSLLRMAEEALAAQGVRVRGLSPVEIAERSLHTTADLPAIMGTALSRRLRMAYEENQPSYRRWARRAPNAPDFRSMEVVQLSSLPDLLKTNEAGEFKYGQMSDGKVSYGLLTYGRIIGVTRQTIVNDDLRALDRLTTGFAAAAARLENRTTYAQLTANANMPYDGLALFVAGHGNLGAAGAIDAVTLGEGRKAMRKQKGLQNEELNLAPRFLIVPTDLEQVAYQFTSSQFVPAKATDVNEFRAGGRTALEPIVEPVLDATSAAQWYLAADSAQVDTVEYSYLEGAEGVQMSSRVGFNVDGIELKASLDFASCVIDHRGLYRRG